MRIATAATLTLLTLAVSTGCMSRKKEVRTVNFGEKAVIGPFVYQAFETRWPLTIGDRTPKDRFFTIRVSVLNSGSAAATIPTFEVVDDAGQSFPELSDGTGVDHWLGVTRKVEVSNSEQGNIVFDVPPKHYRLRVADEDDNFMYIDIPLNLTSEEPDHQQLDRALGTPSK